jgi:type I restriction enzyme S subunit
VFRARLYSDAIEPKLVSWWGNSFGQVHFLREGKQTTNLASINLSKLSQFPIPVPPMPEQQRIVAEIERRLSVVEELETVVNANLQRSTRLRQSILQRAFEGNFVSRYD